MSSRGLPATGQEAAEGQLLAQLGLPASAGPEDVDHLHQAVSEYLAAAPAGIRGWAHAQAAALDTAYLQLTDPVGLGGSALKSPTRPPRVEPGGPATPPARRDLLPAATRTRNGATAAQADDLDTDDLEALYASVTPSAHRDMGPDARRKARKSKPLPGAVVVTPGAGTSDGPWKKIVLGGAGIAAAIGILVAGMYLGGGSLPAIGASGPTAAPQASAPAIDEAKVAGLMQKLQANPNDTGTLLALANEFYAGGQYQAAGQWADKLLAIEPKNIQGLLAKGAIAFNLNDLAGAETSWRQVITIDPKNVEVYYDLGFMYFYQPVPDYAAVAREWSKVIELDPASDMAKNAKAHLDALAAKSLLPGASGAPSGAPSAAPSGSPAASPAASAAPSASPAASPAASAKP